MVNINTFTPQDSFLPENTTIVKIVHFEEILQFGQDLVWFDSQGCPIHKAELRWREFLQPSQNVLVIATWLQAMFPQVHQPICMPVNRVCLRVGVV